MHGRPGPGALRRAASELRRTLAELLRDQRGSFAVEYSVGSALLAAVMFHMVLAAGRAEQEALQGGWILALTP